MSARGGVRDFYLMDADGTKGRRVFGKRAERQFSMWPPEGKRIAYLHREQGLFRLAQHFGDNGTVVSAVLQPIGESFRHKVAVLVGAVPPVAAVGIRQCLLEKGDTAFL